MVCCRPMKWRAKEIPQFLSKPTFAQVLFGIFFSNTAYLTFGGGLKFFLTKNVFRKHSICDVYLCIVDCDHRVRSSLYDRRHIGTDTGTLPTVVLDGVGWKYQFNVKTHTEIVHRFRI